MHEIDDPRRVPPEVVGQNRPPNPQKKPVLKFFEINLVVWAVVIIVAAIFLAVILAVVL